VEEDADSSIVHRHHSSLWQTLCLASFDIMMHCPESLVGQEEYMHGCTVILVRRRKEAGNVVQSLGWLKRKAAEELISSI